MVDDLLYMRGAQAGTSSSSESCDIWRPPDDGWVKINIDASFLAEGAKVGGGVVIRNHQGNLISA
uniref:RNase H type-1 domain-containing protein n=1 Tax=Setaria italica TaxID=4555 RepID=K3YZA3_SETIT